MFLLVGVPHKLRVKICIDLLCYHLPLSLLRRLANTFVPIFSSKRLTTTMAATIGNADGSSSHLGLPSIDVAVIGAGPSGCVMATLLAVKHGLRVSLVDSDPKKQWVPNYGVWVDEWERLAADMPELGILDCLDHTWPRIDAFYGGSQGIPMNHRLTLNRPYARVARDKLKNRLVKRMEESGMVKFESGTINVSSVNHGSDGTTFSLDGSEMSFHAKLVVDCTGYETRLIEKQSPPRSCGFQIAYGIDCEVEAGHKPYDPEAMLFMDYRTNYAISPDEKEDLKHCPTFLYAMPLGKAPSGRDRIFFEETLLVVRPKINVSICKDRLYRRLEHLGITVTMVKDEEFCYIPMGGSLPKFDNRVVAFGGASSVVHPSTG